MRQKSIRIIAAFAAVCAFVAPGRAKASDGESPRVDAFLKKGIHFATEDGNYSLGVAPRIQLRYAYDNREGADDAHSIMVRRFYLTFAGHFLTDDLTYQVTFNGTFGGTPANLLYYSWLNYRVTDAFQVKGGLHKLAFNRQEMTSSGKQQFVDRAIANERFNLDRSTGVVLWGMPFDKRFEYYATVANGRATTVAVNANQELLFAARVAYNPFGEYGYAEGDVADSDDLALTFGLGGSYYQEETTVSVAQDDVIAATADTGFKYRGWSFQGEFFYRSTDPGARTVRDAGATAQAGYFFVPEKFEVAARFSALWDDLGDNGGGVYYNNGSITGMGGMNDGVDEGADSDNEYEYTLGLNYYIKGYNLKVQGQYSFVLDGQAGANEAANHIAMLQAEMQF